VEHARAVIRDHAVWFHEIEQAHDDLSLSMQPAPHRWIVDRLTVLAAMFSIGRHPAAAQDLAIWLAETARMMEDLPHDLLGFAIDDAVKSRSNGFIPSVGEIRAIADPLVAERRLQLDRLGALMGSMQRPTDAPEARSASDLMSDALEDFRGAASQGN
jgi:hypothetical protein